MKRRDYISWSQLTCWEKDPNRYYERYVLGLDEYISKNMDAGKRIAEMLEKGKPKNQIEKSILAKLEQEHCYPGIENREQEISADLEGIKLFGIADGLLLKDKKLFEVKTGVKWTQAQADKLGQIDFYNLMLWLTYKIKPQDNDNKLIWIKTYNTLDEFGQREVIMTDEIKSFTVKKTMTDIIKMSDRIKKADKGIKDMFRTLDI